MHKKPEFYGSTTVGERGQIVLPAKLRKAFKVRQGDKLLVIGMPGGTHITLLRADMVNEFFDAMTGHIERMRADLTEKGD